MDDAGYLIFRIALVVICGAAAAAIAHSKGRNAFGWFWVGFLLGIIGLIIAAVMPNLRKQKQVEEQSELERRRLREQLLQERMKHEAFRQHVTHRLDAHDGALGMETRELGGTENEVLRRLTAGEAQADQTAQGAQAALGALDWYYASAGVTHGPFTLAEVTAQARQGIVNRQTPIWTSDLGRWTPAGEVPELRGGFTA